MDPSEAAQRVIEFAQTTLSDEAFDEAQADEFWTSIMEQAGDQ